MEQPRIRERFSVMNNAYRAYSFSYFLDSMQRLGLDQIDLWGGYQHFDPFSAGPSYLRAFRVADEACLLHAGNSGLPV